MIFDSTNLIFVFEKSSMERQGVCGVSKLKHGWLRLALIATLFLGCISPTWASQPQREQHFHLKVGWNAIFLEVSPIADSVGEVFGADMVDAVARYFVPNSPIRFIEDPQEEPWNTAGWSVWYAPQRAETFLNTLHAVHGGAAYLVHATKAGVLTITGTVVPMVREWKVDSFNLTGFPVDAPGMTFAQYFAGAEGKIGTRVYRMVNGSWQKVTNLASTQIQPGAAYWIYCEGRTTYNGPLEVRMTGAARVYFDDQSSIVTIELRNRINTAFSLEASMESNDGLPLYQQVIDLTNLTSQSVPLTGRRSLGTLAPGQTTVFRLRLRRDTQTINGTAAVLKFTTSNGVVQRVPIHLRGE
jgi:hypothetical protein